MRWICLFAGFLLITLAGCASSGVVKNASPISTGMPVSLDFILVETSSSVVDSEAERSLLNDQIVTGLRETQLFDNVSGNSADTGSGNGMKVSLDIKKIKKVSDTARIWVGALAGRSRILVQVTVTDSKSGNQIEAFSAEGESGGTAKSGTTDQAIQRAAEQVVAEIVKISRQTNQ